MKDKDFYNLIRQAFSRIEGKKREECLSEETVCDYLESQLSASELNKAENHLSLCSRCRKLVTTLIKLQNTKEAESIGTIKAKIDTVTETLKISLAWIRGHLKVKETNAEGLPFWNALQPALVRGDHKQTVPSLPPFSKTFKEYKVVVQAGEEEKGKCEIRCRISSLTKKCLSSRIRVDLIQAQRTLCSYPLENDMVLFSGIEPGDYKIKIREGDRALALLSLDIYSEDME